MCDVLLYAVPESHKRENKPLIENIRSAISYLELMLLKRQRPARQSALADGLHGLNKASLAECTKAKPLASHGINVSSHAYRPHT